MFYIILFFLSFTLTYIIKEYALRNALLAEVNERSSHTVPTPHGGGIAIVFTWFLGISYLYFMQEIDSRLFYALIVGVLISIVGYIDDLYGLCAKKRLLAQSLVALLGIYCLGGFQELNLFFFSIKSQLLTNTFAFFMIVWFINLYNFLDGIDGYAGSESIFLALAGFFLFGGAHFLVLIAALAGFLIWNWHKAKIFMGDVGSTLLGYNIAIFTLYYANEDSYNFWIWIALFTPFWLDATLTLYRRFKNAEKLSIAHKKHFYQRLVQSHWSHAQVTIALTCLNLLSFLFILLFKNIFIAFVVIMGLHYAIIKFIDSKKAFV